MVALLPKTRRMKFRAPPPPSATPPAPEPAPPRTSHNAVPDGGGGGGQGSWEAKENVLRPSLDIHLTLPHGYQTTTTVDSSKALMDLLVELCSQYHLNPAHHTLELLSPEGQLLAFKPNAILGMLDVACVLIKEKVWEEKVVRRPPPKVPEKTVRLVVNYHQSQKAVVRVNPLVPLQTLVLAICDKCEFDPAHVLLLRDDVSHRELPLDKSLSELAIRELYVLDQSLVLQPKMASAPTLHYRESVCSSTLTSSGSERKGLLGLFKFNRAKSKGISPVSATCVEARPSTLGQSRSVMNISRMSPKAEPKKRRAPPPPAPTPIPGQQHFTMDTDQQVSPGSPRSDSQQRKRKAPAPPPTPASITTAPDTPPTPASITTAPDTPPTPASITTAPDTPPSPASITTGPDTPPTPASITTGPDTAPTPTSTPAPSSPGSSSTAASLLAQNSSSDLSHSTSDDSEAAGSICSTSSCSSSLGMAVATTTASCTRSSEAGKVDPAPSLGSQEADKVDPAPSLGSQEAFALNLKVEEVENNRHSTMVYCCGPVRLPSNWL